jgi:4,5-DOPA dioxygenase extradiol
MTAESAITNARDFPLTPPMPVLFVGHGSPMNAIEDNEFSRSWRGLGSTLPLPRAILCVSAHWETRGTRLTALAAPPTIHDFFGFPPELFAVTYPAPGSPLLAHLTRSSLASADLRLDTEWGLDHGCWSVVRRMYPQADVPVIQMSLDTGRTPAEHLALGRELAFLRTRGVLVIGSGNIVHNLRLLAWERQSTGFDWAVAADELLRRLIAGGDSQKLAAYPALGEEIALSIPTPEHFLPLLYVLALRHENDPLAFFNDRTILGSISMTSVRIG